MKRLIISLALLASSIGTVNASDGRFFAQCVSEPLVRFEGTIVDAAIATPELSTLVDAVVAAGLADALASAEGITVFAPTNAAFAKLGPILDAALADTDLLTAVLTYHVVPGLTDPRKWILPSRRDTLADQTVFLHRDDAHPRVNQSIVDCVGVRTDNGLVWIIDSVLLPQL